MPVSRAKELFEMLERLSESGHSLMLERARLSGFDAYEDAQSLEEAVWWIAIHSERTYTRGVWRGYSAGVFTDREGNVLGVYATRYVRDEELGFYSSVTYVATFAPRRLTLVERFGEAVRVDGFKEWRESRREKGVECPALPPELARSLLEELRAACTYTRIADAKGTPILWPNL